VHEQALIAPPYCLDIDNPVTVGGVDPDLSYQATTNPQYQYDAKSALETILEEEHGKVCADVSIFPVCVERVINVIRLLFTPMSDNRYIVCTVLFNSS